MAWGDAAAEQYEKDQPSDYVREDESVRGGVLTSSLELRAKYQSLIDRANELERQATEAANELWKFMDDRAFREAAKPYEICGDDDGQGRRHLECQLPKGHREMGYRNHLEMRGGKVWGAWS